MINSINKYNNNLDIISQKILNLKISLKEDDIEVRNLCNLFRELSVINNIKSRKTTEELLKNVLNEYAYQLQTEVESK